MELHTAARLFLLLVVRTGAVRSACSVSSSDKIDCGYYGIDQDSCESKGCCWQPVYDSGVDSPWCFFDSNDDDSASDDTLSTCFVLDGSEAVADSPPFNVSIMELFKTNFLSQINVDGVGAVVAAPDHDTPGGDYYYHWERDGALTMRCLQETATGEDNTTSYMKAYTSWVQGRQAESDPNGIDVLTEPKYEIPSGQVYEGAWCRPQNDGPGLRAIALMIFANSLLEKGESDYVTSNLFGADAPNGGAIYHDLQYLVDGGWSSNTCDLWEEVESYDFFWNRATMYRALIMGADFATSLGDDISSAAYLETATAVGAALAAHDNGEYVYESTNREIDGAVICAINDGYSSADDSMSFVSPYEEVSARTVVAYIQAFCDEYSINTQDSDIGIPGVLIGRYPGDTYAGGNPWVLTTAALAQLFYRAALQTKMLGLPSEAAQEQWSQLQISTSTAQEMAQSLATAGDSIMLRLSHHVSGDGGRLDEQIDRDSGLQTSAESLTWSYAEVLNAMKARSDYFA